MKNIANTKWKHKNINTIFMVVEVIEGAMSLYNQSVVVFVNVEGGRKTACTLSDFKKLADPLEEIGQ